MPDPNTAQAGAAPAPGQTEESPTSTGAAPTTDPNVELDTDGKPLPFDKHPKWIAARQAEKALQALLTANGVEDVDELRELVETGGKLKGKAVDVDNLEAIAEKAARLDKYEAYWAAQAEAEKRKTEDPADTQARLDKENAELRRKLATRDEARDAATSLQGYEKEVNSKMKELLPDLPDEDRPFVLEFFGIGNPFADINIDDKAAVARMVKGGVKKLEAYVQQRIKRHLEGKDKTIPITPVGGGTAPETGKIKNLKEARRALKAWGSNLAP